MTEKYEYHKRNDYPGERTAEKKRVADRKATADRRSDARVAEKGRTEGLKADARVAKGSRRHDDLMDSQVERNAARAKGIRRQRDSADAIGLAIIAGLVVLLLVGSVWGFMGLRGQAKEIDMLNSQLAKANANNYQLSLANMRISGSDDTTPPTILYLSPLSSVSPSNNQVGVATTVRITAEFSEDMNPLTVNKDTFQVEQRTTPESGSYRSLPIEGTVTYNDRTATFISKDRFYPNQIYGNVFTVTVTKGVKDLAGNQLANDYVWSFTTGDNPFNTGTSTS